MRQTLFYLTLDQPFAWLPDGAGERSILHVGLGLLILAILLVSSLWTYAFTPRGAFSWQRMGWNFVQGAGIVLLLIWFSPFRIIPVYGYGSMLLVGFLAAATWAGYRAERVGIRRETIWDVAMLILVLGIAGARLFYLVQYRQRVYAGVETFPQFLQATLNLSEGGLVLYGGVILGTIGYFTFCYLNKLHPLQLADVIVPSIFLGLGFGRLGCLLNGCCFGDRCDLPWAITFPAGSVPYQALLQLGFLPPDAAASLPLHPSQIYSSLGGFLLAYVTATVFRHRRKAGEVLAVGAIFYPINRFLIEFVRGDEFTQLDTGLTISQLVSLWVLAAGVCYLIWLEMRGKTLQEIGQASG